MDADINAPATSPCQCNNADLSLPWVEWMKRACPSYVFPFDDATSTFQYRNLAFGNKNTVGYTITFCPGGKEITRNVLGSTPNSGQPTLSSMTLTVAVAGIVSAVCLL